MDHQESLNWIDACRPDHDDLADAELSALAARLDADPQARLAFERSQRFDRAVLAAMHDLPVPDGLSEKLLVQLGLTAGAASEHPETIPLESAAPPRRVSRRLLFKAGAGLAAASLLAGAGFYFLQPADDNTLSVEVAAQQGFEAFGELDPQDPAIRRDSPGSRAFPLGAHIDPRYMVGWQTHRLAGRPGVAYHLSGPRGRPRGVLFVAQLNGSPSMVGFPGPGMNTGHRWSTAWKNNDQLYVLVIQGSQRDLRNVNYFKRSFTIT